MRHVLLIALCCLIPASVYGQTVQELTEKEFRDLHQKLRPAKDEPYLTIPWKTSLLDAQKTAATERKPIFIWAMDGHPLGCT